MHKSEERRKGGQAHQGTPGWTWWSPSPPQAVSEGRFRRPPTAAVPAAVCLHGRAARCPEHRRGGRAGSPRRCTPRLSAPAQIRRQERVAVALPDSRGLIRPGSCWGWHQPGSASKVCGFREWRVHGCSTALLVATEASRKVQAAFAGTVKSTVRSCKHHSHGVGESSDPSQRSHSASTLGNPPSGTFRGDDPGSRAILWRISRSRGSL